MVNTEHLDATSSRRDTTNGPEAGSFREVDLRRTVSRDFCLLCLLQLASPRTKDLPRKDSNRIFSGIREVIHVFYQRPQTQS
jgi:hypothetical protein